MPIRSDLGSDREELSLLVGKQLVDASYLVVRELLEFFSTRSSSSVESAPSFERFDVMARGPAYVAHGDSSLFCFVADDLHQLLTTLFGERRKASRMTLPSLVGLIPRSEDWMAFSMAPSDPLS